MHAAAVVLFAEIAAAEAGEDSKNTSYVTIHKIISSLTPIIQLKRPTSNWRSSCGLDPPISLGLIISNHFFRFHCNLIYSRYGWCVWELRFQQKRRESCALLCLGLSSETEKERNKRILKNSKCCYLVKFFLPKTGGKQRTTEGSLQNFFNLSTLFSQNY